MQRVWATIMLALIMILSISIQTNGNEKRSDLARAPSSAFAPQSEDGLIPNPIACIKDVRTIPNCINSVKHFRLKEVTKKCCTILLNLPEDCFGYVFPVPFIYRTALKLTCKILGHT